MSNKQKKMKKMQRLILYLALALLVFSHLQAAYAETAYTIPIYGRWRSSTIGVKLPSDPGAYDTARDAAINAMNIWNQAQTWFKETYAPNSRITYVLIPSSTGQVEIRFVKTEKEFYAIIPLRATGAAQMHIVKGVIQSGIVYFNMERISKDGADFQYVATHELGHVLGLDHTQFRKDLMCGPPWLCDAPPWRYTVPSTLDLFAVQILAQTIQGTLPPYVMLPSTISYSTVPNSAIPEFPTSTILLALATLALLVSVRKRKRRTTL